MYDPEKIDPQTGLPKVIGTQRRNLMTGLGPLSFGPAQAADQSIGFTDQEKMKHKHIPGILDFIPGTSGLTPGTAPGRSASSLDPSDPNYDPDIYGPGRGKWTPPPSEEAEDNIQNVIDRLRQKEKAASDTALLKKQMMGQ